MTHFKVGYFVGPARNPAMQSVAAKALVRLTAAERNDGKQFKELPLTA